MATQDEIVDILVESYPNNKCKPLSSFLQWTNENVRWLPNSGKEVIETWVLFADQQPYFVLKLNDL